VSWRLRVVGDDTEDMVSGITGFSVVTDQTEAITLMADLAETRLGAPVGVEPPPR
jgi:hypothetical protein